MAIESAEDQNENGLTKNEAAAIYIYTMEGTESEYSLYRQLNKDLRSKNRQSLKKWFSYLKLFMTALDKLPSQRCTAWRGIKLDVSEDFSKGTEGVWWGVISATLDTSILEHNTFLGTHGTRTLFSIECEHGKDIRSYSYFQQHKEVLLKPGFHFKVTNVLKLGPGAHIIHLKEINSPL